MYQKEHLTTRLDPELLERLRRVSVSLNAPISSTISLALDALEREELLAERMDNLEGNHLIVMEVITKISDKLDAASFNEKERLKSLLQLLEAKILAHDEAEQARFERFHPRI